MKKNNRFSSMYKKGGEKQDFISKKISELVDENFSHQQAVAIALNMAEDKFQKGGTKTAPLYGAESMFPIVKVDKADNGYNIYYKDPQLPDFNPENDVVKYDEKDFKDKLKLTSPDNNNPGQYDPYLLQYMKKTNNRLGQTVTYQFGGQQAFIPYNFESAPQGYFNNQINTISDIQNNVPPVNLNPNLDIPKELYPNFTQEDKNTKDKEVGLDLIDYTQPEQTQSPETNKNTQGFQNTQFFNPYAGVDLETSSAFLGKSIADKDPLGIVAGGLKTTTNLARNILGGFGQEKVKNESIKNYMDNQRDLMMNKPGFQEGGEQQDQMQQVYQMVSEALQQGVDPQQIAQELINMGIPQETVGQIIQQIAQELQGQSPQEEQIEGQYSNAQEEQVEQPMMKNGGNFMEQLVGKKIIGYKYNKDSDTYTVEYE